MRAHHLCLALLLPALLAGCSLQRGSSFARKAPTQLLGMTEADIDTCMGVPVRRQQLGATTILTFATTTSSTGGLSMALPLLGDLSMTGNGSSCAANIRLDYGRVTQVRYTGDYDAMLAPQAYCGALVRSCVEYPLMYANKPLDEGGVAKPVFRSRPVMPADAPENRPEMQVERPGGTPLYLLQLEQQQQRQTPAAPAVPTAPAPPADPTEPATSTPAGTAR